MFERALDKCGDYVDFIWTGEDLGTQIGPLISLDLFRSQIRPRHQPLIDLAAQYGKPVMIHSCGSGGHDSGGGREKRGGNFGNYDAASWILFCTYPLLTGQYSGRKCDCHVQGSA